MSFKTADLLRRAMRTRIQICDPEFYAASADGCASMARVVDDPLFRGQLARARGGRRTGATAVCWWSMRAVRGAARCSATCSPRKAVENGWSGVVMNGMIRDSADIAAMDLGVSKALGTHPLKSVKRGVGERDVPVRFAGVIVHAGLLCVRRRGRRDLQ